MASALLVISTSTELIRVPQDRVIFIASNGNYSTITTGGGDELVVTYQLGQIEAMLASQFGDDDDTFVRIGKQLIVNMNYIHYINISRQKLVLKDYSDRKYELSASREALKQLKALFEDER
ncbi:MAG: LytTR family transcriptional regulator DNA-binding domain-containing protein [Muribaculaceae bacterium]|nr:LytTR family transcriptional regulator DNA-binding domain-containing protein [Muribaculaceae bacterium]